MAYRHNDGLIRGNLDKKGSPVVRLRLSVGDEEAAKRRQYFSIGLPAPVELSACIDTGCNMTEVSRQAIGTLGLLAFDRSEVATANGSVWKHIYRARLELLDNTGRAAFTIRDGRIRDLPPSPLPIQALVGTDVLSHAIFMYDGPERGYSLNFSHGVAKK